MARRKRRRAPNEGGSIDQLPSGRWRLRVRLDGGQVTYGTYETEEGAFSAQARWRLTHLLVTDDPQLPADVVRNVTVGGVLCDEWFELAERQFSDDERKNMSCRQPRGQETRERILAVALSDFAARGYDAVSVEDIASAAGVTKGAVYYWFTDKDDIGRDLQHELYDRLVRDGLAALDPDADADTVTSIRRALEVFVDTLDNLGEARFFLRDAWTIPELDVGTVADGQAAVALLRGVLVGGMARGEIVTLDPDALARVLFGALTEATLYILTTGQRTATLNVIDHLVESLGTDSHVAELTPTANRGRHA